MEPFAAVPEQAEAKRLLISALQGESAHGFLLHGPAGVGKTAAAFAFAGALLGDERRVRARTHPDLRVVEALGEMIRIDAIRELHRDLHMRPYEGSRRVYLLLDAHLLNDEAADALLKDLEEPPAYATLILVADELGPIPETVPTRWRSDPRFSTRWTWKGTVTASSSGWTTPLGSRLSGRKPTRTSSRRTMFMGGDPRNVATNVSAGSW